MSDSLMWVKAKASGGSGGNCVEVAGAHGKAFVRDSKSPERGMLTVSRDAFRRFIEDHVGDSDL